MMAKKNIKVKNKEIEALGISMSYTFEDEETGEQFDLEMPSAVLDDFLKYHPKIFRVFKMNLGDAVRLGVQKPPSDFQKYVLGRIKSAVPQSKVENRWNIKKEI